MVQNIRGNGCKYRLMWLNELEFLHNIILFFEHRRPVSRSLNKHILFVYEVGSHD
jgi:hypothetical protein